MKRPRLTHRVLWPAIALCSLVLFSLYLLYNRSSSHRDELLDTIASRDEHILQLKTRLTFQDEQRKGLEHIIKRKDETLFTQTGLLSEQDSMYERLAAQHAAQRKRLQELVAELTEGVDGRPEDANEGSARVSPDAAAGSPNAKPHASRPHARRRFKSKLVTTRNLGVGSYRPVLDLDSEEFAKARTVFHVVSHTHWDREWYLPFETFRGRLVKLMDRVLNRIKTDEHFRHFHFDGQMIPIDDYLEIRPHMRNDIKTANEDGYLTLGPWYIQPDEFLVSAEALVRNLLLGIRLAKELGGTSRVGYIPDSFGHISQMPQLLLGFDIGSCVSGRGLAGNVRPESLWAGPDGSEVLFIFLKAWYCNALEMPRGGDANSLKRWFAKMRTEQQRHKVATKHLLLMNGCDHSAIDPNVGDFIHRANGAFGADKLQVAVHSNLDDYVALVRREVFGRAAANAKLSQLGELDGRAAAADSATSPLTGEGRGSGPNSTRASVARAPSFPVGLQTTRGELRVAVEGLANTLSNKISQKQANFELQALIEQWMEPMSVYGWKIGGAAYDSDTIWYAWKLVMQNHPHDSICGCSSAEVHSEVDMRFQKAKQVVDQANTFAAIGLLPHLRLGDEKTGAGRIRGVEVVVMNPTAIPRREVVVAEVERKVGAAFAAIESVTDREGRAVPADLLRDFGRVWTYELPDIGFRKPTTVSRARIAFEATVPPMGYARYTVAFKAGTTRGSRTKRGGKNAKSASKTAENTGRTKDGRPVYGRKLLEVGGRDVVGASSRGRKHRSGGRATASQAEAMNILLRHTATMENRYLLVTVLADGSVNVVDKQTRLVYQRLNWLEDTGDRGDQYRYQKFGHTKRPSSAETTVGQVVSFNTAQLVRVRTSMPGLQGLDITVVYLLKRGSRRLEVRVELDNQLQGHRLQAKFGLNASAPLVFSDSQFEVLQRNARSSQPQWAFTTIVDPNGQHAALTVANRGLPEYDVSRLYSLTLIRSTDRIGDWMKQSPVPSAQEQGLHAFEYAIIPHRFKPSASPFADVEARSFNQRLIAVSDSNYDGYVPKPLIDLGMSELREFALARPTSQIEFVDPPLLDDHFNTDLVAFLQAHGDLAMDPRSHFQVLPAKLVITSVKRAEDRDSAILRFYNPYATSHLAVVRTRLPGVRGAYMCRIDETRLSPLQSTGADGEVFEARLMVLAKKIVTIEFVFVVEAPDG